MPLGCGLDSIDDGNLCTVMGIFVQYAYARLTCSGAALVLCKRMNGMANGAGRMAGTHTSISSAM